MQIDVLTKYFHPVTAGIETNIRETYSVLVKKGWTVNIHTTSNSYTEKGTLPEKEIVKNLNVKRYKFFGELIGYFPKINLSDTSIVAFHNFNFFNVWFLLYIYFLKLIVRKKFAVIVTPHGGFNPEWRVFTRLQGTIKRFYHKTLGVFLINNVVDGVRAVSEWEKEELIKEGVNPAKIRVIVNGLENEAFADVEKLASAKIKKEIKKWGKYIIQVGRIYPIKNYETTIKALKKLPSNIKYVIVGPIEKNQYPEYINGLENLIKNLRLEKRVIFAGVISGIDKYYVIKNSLMMVHMAIWESFCNVVHEALSQGKVCIVANNTALPYLIKNGLNGFLVETFDKDALYEKIKYVYANLNSERHRKMAENNIKAAKNETWENVAVNMDSWYSKLIKSI
jgi:glycosyltransferase involved in cell wall biosynthesis